MEDADPKAARQKRPCPAAPGPVLGAVAEDARDVVAPVVVNDEEPALGPQDPVDLRGFGRIDAAECGPQADHDVHRPVRQVGPKGGRERLVHDPGAEDPEPGSGRRAGSIDEQDVPTGHGAQRIEPPEDLALHIERGCQPSGEIAMERERQVRHGDGSIGAPTTAAARIPATATERRHPRPGWLRPLRRRRSVRSRGPLALPTAPSGRIPAMFATVRAMPGPIRVFLVYPFVILAGIGVSLPFVVDLPISAPVSPPGIVVMVLLAYTIFTITLVLQRKEAGRGFALGLSSLTVPPIPWAIVVGQPILAIFLTALALILIRGLRRPEVAAYLIEP